MTLPQAASVRVVSKRIRDSLVKDRRFCVAEGKITVLPMYAEKQNARAAGSDAFPQFDKIALIASRLEPEKSLEDALVAFSIAQRVHPRTGLLIAGEGSLRARLEAKARSLGIADKTIFLGWQSREELAGLYAIADVYLSASLYEGYGLSLVEAAQAGVPIVSTDAGIAPDLLPQKRLAVPGDMHSLELLLEEALHYPERFVPRAEGIAAVTYRSKGEYLERYRESLLL
jgi:glycosyltransferase involved in cell wall biosynthesis